MQKNNYLLQKKARYQLKSFMKDCGISSVKNTKILEIGFKNGLFLNECYIKGFNCTGTEVNKDYYKITKRKFPYLNLKLVTPSKQKGLNINSFDYIVSFQVAEHVSSTKHILNESMKLLKHGGLMYHVCPNYNSFYEGHYNVFWLPFLNKKTGRWYLKILGKYTPYYETLNIVKPKVIKQWVEGQKNAELISLGKFQFIEKIDDGQINKIHQPFIRSFITILKKMGIYKFVFKILTIANMHYPLVIIIKKTR